MSTETDDLRQMTTTPALENYVIAHTLLIIAEQLEEINENLKQLTAATLANNL